jgi:hypothetical protein
VTNPDCDVCCGRGKIRVPVYRPLDVRMVDIPALDVMESPYRDYPCPECSEVVPLERVQVVAEQRLANSTPENDPRYIESCKYSMVRELAGTLLERNLVKFERGPTDDYQMRFAMRMTVGVVAPRAVATLEERVAEHQEALAREVMAEATRSISNWGSYYNAPGLSKAQAIDSVDGALQTVLKARAKWRAT